MMRVVYRYAFLNKTDTSICNRRTGIDISVACRTLNENVLTTIFYTYTSANILYNKTDCLQVCQNYFSQSVGANKILKQHLMSTHRKIQTVQ